jgi:hypothetical protein
VAWELETEALPAEDIRDGVNALTLPGEPTEEEEVALAAAKIAAIRALNFGIVGDTSEEGLTAEYKVTLSGDHPGGHPVGEFGQIRIEKVALAP